MNKKEKQDFADLESKIELLKAKLSLHFTEKVECDVMIPSENSPFGILAKGFLFYSHSRRVEKACTSRTNHSMGNDDKTTMQNARPLYSSELLAWKAMRNELEDRFASELRKIDLRIDALTLNPQ